MKFKRNFTLLKFVRHNIKKKIEINSQYVTYFIEIKLEFTESLRLLKVPLENKNGRLSIGSQQNDGKRAWR